MENQRLMEQAGLHPIPVFHGGEDWGVLREYAQEYDYISLGGIAGGFYNKKLILSFLDKCFSVVGSTSRIHGLGMTSIDWLKFLDFKSVDSSSWGSGYRYGSLPVFDERGGRMVPIRLSDRRDCLRYGYLIRSYGQNPLDYADHERNNRKHNIELGAASFMRLEKWITEIQEKKREYH